MKERIKCKFSQPGEVRKVKVKIIKAPLVETKQLRSIILDRAKALVL